MAGSRKKRDRASAADPSKIRDRALVNLLVGMVLLMPPVAGIFETSWTIQGIPVTLVYLFAVWAILIVSARWLASRLPRGSTMPAAADADSPD